MRPKLIIALLAALVALALLAGCGDEDASGPTQTDDPAAGTAPEPATTGESAADSEAISPAEDRANLEAAIEALLVDRENEFVCAEVLSPKLLRIAYGDLDGCLKGRDPRTLADSLPSTRKLRLDGDEASAEAIANGGLYDGATLQIDAVREGDDGWRIDQFIADLPVGP